MSGILWRLFARGTDGDTVNTTSKSSQQPKAPDKEIGAVCTIKVKSSVENNTFSTDAVTVRTAVIHKHQLANLVWSTIGYDTLPLVFNNSQEKSYSTVILREHVADVCKQIVASKWGNSNTPLTFKKCICGISINIDAQIYIELSSQ